MATGDELRVGLRTIAATDLLMSGRESAVAAIEDRLPLLLQGEGGHIEIDGPPGSGRTTLLDAAATWAASLGISCMRAGPAAPLSPYDLVTGQEDPDQALDRTPGPVLVCVDDFERCDIATRMMSRLRPASTGARDVLWIIAGDLARGRARTADGGGAHRLGPLSPVEAQALAERTAAPKPLDPALVALLQSGPRWPRQIVETVRHQARQRLLGGSLAPPRVWPEALERSCDPAQRALLGAAAVLGLSFTMDELAVLSGGSSARLVRPLQRALADGVLVEEGTRFAFAHPLVRSQFLQAIDDSTRKRELIDAVIELHLGRRDVDRLAATATEFVAQIRPEMVGRLAAFIAPKELDAASRLLRFHLAAGTLPDDQAADLQSDLVSYELHLGEPTTSGYYAERLSSSMTAATAFAVGEMFFPSHTRDVERLVERVLASSQVSSVDRARLRSVAVVCRAYANEFDAADLAEASNLASTAKDERAHALVRMARALDDAARGDLLEALRQSALASEQPASLGLGPGWWIAAGFRAKLLTDLGRADEAEHVLEVCIRTAERRGFISALPNLLMVRATCAIERGHLHHAANLLSGSRRLAAAVGRAGLVETNCLSLLTRIAHLQGDKDALLRLSKDLEDTIESNEVRRETARGGVMVAADALGDLATFTARATSETASVPRIYAVARGVTDEIGRVRLLHRRGLDEEAARARELLDRIADQVRSPLPTAAAHHAAGLLAGDARAIRTARAIYQDLGRPMLDAQAAEDLAALASSTVETTELLRAARTRWQECAAHREVARVEHMLREIGARSAPHTSTTSTLDLSGAEERVVRELLKGGSNADIASALYLSKNTVAVHLRRIYAKTGTANRTELIELLRRTSPPAVRSELRLSRSE